MSKKYSTATTTKKQGQKWRLVTTTMDALEVHLLLKSMHYFNEVVTARRGSPLLV
jgi:hypothetical protein